MNIYQIDCMSVTINFLSKTTVLWIFIATFTSDCVLLGKRNIISANIFPCFALPDNIWNAVSYIIFNRIWTEYKIINGFTKTKVDLLIFWIQEISNTNGKSFCNKFFTFCYIENAAQILYLTYFWMYHISLYFEVVLPLFILKN